MGACLSTEDQKQPKKSPQADQFPKKQVDRSVLVQTQKKNEEIRRNPGDIGGNQFCVDELENCKVIINDLCDSMTIDRCTNCELILCSVRGSIFVRDCVNSKFQMVCGQFRCRSCTNCDFFMHVKTPPVVESSVDVRIGCATVYYPDLLNQMKQCGIDQTSNFWTDVHDFTPGDGNFSYNSGSMLELSIMDKTGRVLPFIHKKGSAQNMKYFFVTVAENQLDALIEKSYEEGVHLLSVKREQNRLKCEFEAPSLADLENQIQSLNASIVDDND